MNIFDPYFYVTEEKIDERGDIPKKVEEIADAIRRDNPDFSDEKAYKLAWSTYKKYRENRGLPYPHPKKEKMDEEFTKKSILKYLSKFKQLELKVDGKMYFLDIDDEPTPMKDGIYALDNRNKEVLIKYKDIDTVEPIVGSSVFTEAAHKRWSEYETAIHDFLMDHPAPKDEEVHQFAAELGVTPEELEEHIYQMLRKYMVGDETMREPAEKI